MGWFDSEPQLERVDAGTWKLVRPLRCYLDEDMAGWYGAKYIEVPTGFHTDGASIPRLPLTRAVIGSPLMGKYVRPAIVHDFGYFLQVANRGLIDRIFERGMADDETEAWRRHLVYGAVDIGGCVAWRNHTKERVSRGEPEYFADYGLDFKTFELSLEPNGKYKEDNDPSDDSRDPNDEP